MNIKNLNGIIPEFVLVQLPSCRDKFQIQSALQLSHFLAQCAYESSNFLVTQENFNFSASALEKLYGEYFTDREVMQYARQPKKIANRVRANNFGNGDESSGDGYLYLGRGYFLMIGRDNYASFGKAINSEAILVNPDLVATKYPLLSAAYIWHLKRLNAVADKGIDDYITGQITRAIADSNAGLTNRILLTNRYYNLLKEV